MEERERIVHRKMSLEEDLTNFTVAEICDSAASISGIYATLIKNVVHVSKPCNKDCQPARAAMLLLTEIETFYGKIVLELGRRNSVNELRAIVESWDKIKELCRYRGENDNVMERFKKGVELPEKKKESWN
jgi:hypothetical protein